MNVSGVGETGHACQYFDAIARELRADNVDFGFDDMLRAERKIGHGDLILHAIVHAVDVLVVETGEMQHRFTNCLTGNCAGVDGRAADHLELLNESHVLAEFGGLDRSALACRPRTYNNEIVLFHRETPIEAAVYHR